MDYISESQSQEKQSNQHTNIYVNGSNYNIWVKVETSHFQIIW